MDAEDSPEVGSDRNLILYAAELLEKSVAPEDRWLGQAVNNYRDHFGNDLVPFAIEYLGVIVGDPEFARKQQLLTEAADNVAWSLSLPEMAGQWGTKFLAEILNEIRQAICGHKRKGKAVRAVLDLSDRETYTKAIGASVATIVMGRLGVTEPVAIGVATLALITVGNATKNAFCTMTEQEVLDAIQARK